MTESRGAVSDLTRRIAACGTHGKFAGNIERDLMRVLKIPVDSWLSLEIVLCSVNIYIYILTSLSGLCFSIVNNPGHSLLHDLHQEPEDANWPRRVSHTVSYATRIDSPSLCTLFALYVDFSGLGFNILYPSCGFIYP